MGGDAYKQKLERPAAGGPAWGRQPDRTGVDMNPDRLTDIAIDTLVDLCQSSYPRDIEIRLRAATTLLHHCHHVESEKRYTDFAEGIVDIANPINAYLEYRDEMDSKEKLSPKETTE